MLTFSLQTSAFLRLYLFALDGPSNVIRKKLKSLRREFLHPSRRLDCSSYCVVAGLQVSIQFSLGFTRADLVKPLLRITSIMTLF